MRLCAFHPLELVLVVLAIRRRIKIALVGLLVLAVCYGWWSPRSDFGWTGLVIAGLRSSGVSAARCHRDAEIAGHHPAPRPVAPSRDCGRRRISWLVRGSSPEVTLGRGPD